MILPEVNIKKILFATDLSESSVYAFSFAASLATRYGAGITLLHVLFNNPDSDAAVQSVISEDEWKEIRQRHYADVRETLIGKKRDHVIIKEVLETFTENANTASDEGGFVADEILVVKGDPVDQILATADKRNCDIIVMGSHGRGGLVSALIGSTAKKVVRQSKKPVLVIRLPK